MNKIFTKISYISGSLTSVTIAGTTLALANWSEIWAIIQPNNVAVVHLTIGLWCTTPIKNRGRHNLITKFLIKKILF